MQKLNPQSFSAIAFDVEGTLADTLPAHRTARLAAFKQHGYGHITRAEHDLGPTYGSSSPDILGGILHAAGAIDKTVPFADNPLIQEIMRTRAALYATMASKGFEAMPGAVDFVQAVASLYGGRLVLVTSAEERFVSPFVERYNLSEYFPTDYLIGADTIAGEGLKGKPSPDPYLLAMKRLGIEPTELLVFEDTVPGVVAAKKAGATVIALGFDAQNAKLFASGALEYPPDVFVQDYDEAKQVLGL